MKYLKVLGLAALVAGLMAIAGTGSASATELDCGVTMCATGTAIQAHADDVITLHQGIGDIECSHSELEATTANTGGSSETVKANVSGLTFTECGAAMTVLVKGTLEFHTREASSDNNGTLTSSSTEITQEFAGFHCIFKTNNTDIGTVTGTATTGGNARLDLAATIPRTGGRSGSFCGSTAQWTGSYRFTAPTSLNVT